MNWTTHLDLPTIIGDFTLITAGWTYNFLPELESLGILPIPSRYWSIDLHVEGQCSSEDSCSVCDLGMEFMGCISFHECSSKPKKKSPCPLPRVPHVCISWFPHHCHWLRPVCFNKLGMLLLTSFCFCYWLIWCLETRIFLDGSSYSVTANFACWKPKSV